MNQLELKQINKDELIKFENQDICVFSQKSNKVNISDGIVKSGVEILRDTSLIKETSKLFKCTVNASELGKINGKYGEGFGTAVYKNGKLDGHAAFNNVDGGDIYKIITPFAVYQVASIAFGQYFMLQINHSLKDIDSKLNEILKHFENEKQAKIVSLINAVRVMSQEENLDDGDIMFLKHIKLEADDIRLYHLSNLLDNSSKRVSEYVSIDNYLVAEKIMQACDIFTYKYYTKSNEPKSAIKSIQRLLNTEKILENDFNMISKFSEKDKIVLKSLEGRSKKIDNEFAYLKKLERQLFSKQQQDVYFIKEDNDVKLLVANF